MGMKKATRIPTFRRKCKIIFTLFALLMLLFALDVCAAGDSLESGVTQQALQEGDAYIDEFYSIIPDGIDKSEIDLYDIGKFGIESVMSMLISGIGEGGGAIGFLLLTFALSLCMALPTIFNIGSSCVKGSYGASCIGAAFIFSALYPLVVTCSETLRELGGFISSLSTLFGAVSVASGSESFAIEQTVNMNICSQFILTISNGVLMPTVCIIFCVGMLSALDSGELSVSADRTVRDIFVRVIGILALVFTGCMCTQSVIASAADSLALRGVKYAASSTVPMVGAAVSSGLSVFVGAMSYVKGVVGGGAVMVILLLCFGPLITLFIYRTILSCASSFLLSFGVTGGGVCMRSFAYALDALIALYLLSTLTSIIMAVVFMTGGASVV